MAKLKGGDKVYREIERIAGKIARGADLKVGFLAGATYSDGKPVAMIASIQEFGAPRAGIPARPFFRNMIAAKKGEWPRAIADLIKDNDYDVGKAFNIAGYAIAGQLRQSIIDTNTPPNAPSTIAKKGFNAPLRDSGHMLNSIGHQVTTKKPG